MTGTSGRQRASNEAVATYLMVRPGNFDLWKELGNIVDPMFERIAANAAESQTLVAIRDFLLPKLLSCEVLMKDAENLVGEAT
jgi:type I restriction enzyme, S subunit